MTVVWNEVTIWWNEVTKGWNEVAWNEVVMERSDRNSKISSKLMFSRFTEVLKVAMATSELRACVGGILLRGIILHWHRCSLEVRVLV